MKADKKGHRPNKRTVVILSLMLILVFGAGAALAWLATATPQVENAFTPGCVSSEIIETLGSNTKEDVKVQNTGNADAYIRAAVVINLADAGGNIYAIAPEQGTQYTISYGVDWQLLGGYYYYKGIVNSGDSTTNLINSCIGEAGIPAGYYLKVQILADAIQAEGVTTGGVAAVTNAWGVSFSDGSWS